MKVYHISYPSNRQSILDSGLIPQKSDKYAYLGYEPRIFFFVPVTERDILIAFYHTRDENMDIWEIEIEDCVLNKDMNSEAENHFWIDFEIKAKLYKSNINMWDIKESDFL